MTTSQHPRQTGSYHPYLRADGTARIALLPIEVNAPTEDDKWVGGGMGTQLRAAINKLDGVAVISGVSVNAYRGSNRDINKIRENLNVNYILDCEMAVAGENVTAVVEFINAATHRRSGVKLTRTTSIFNIKSDIAYEDWRKSWIQPKIDAKL